MPSSPSSSLLLPFESLINRCIEQDAVLAAGVTRLAGRTLEIEVTFPRLRVLTTFHRDSVTLSIKKNLADNGEESAFDGRISGSATTLLGLLNRSGDRPLVNPELRISGDVEFVQAVYGLFRNMEIDWQEPLSRVIGDIPTHTLERFAQGVAAFLHETRDSVKRNLDEYLHEEARVVPPRSLVNGFDRRLDELRLRLDRLEAREQRLTDQLSARNS